LFATRNPYGHGRSEHDRHLATPHIARAARDYALGEPLPHPTTWSAPLIMVEIRRIVMTEKPR